MSYKAALGGGVNKLIAHKFLGMVGVVLAGQGAFLYFSPAIGYGFAHFYGHQASQLMLALTQQGSGAAHALGAVAKGRSAPGKRHTRGLS
jgi:hypothetical protein